MRITARANRPAPDVQRETDPYPQSINKPGLERITKKIQSSAGNSSLDEFNASQAYEEARNFPYNRKQRNMAGHPDPTIFGDPETVQIHSALETVTRKVKQPLPIASDQMEALLKQGVSSARVEPIVAEKPFQSKGALFLFQGAEGPGTDSPFISLFFQRFPTSIDYSVNSNISEQNIAGQTGTSLQNLGSTSRKISMEVLFHDAFLQSEQISTHRALAVLDNMIRNGWKYKLFLRIGARSRMTCVLINSIKVSMEHFAGDRDAGDYVPNQTKISQLKDTYHAMVKQMGDYRVPDAPQKAVAQLEFIEDLSKDVVVAFKKRSPKRAKPPAKPKEQLVCMTADEFNEMSQALVSVSDQEFRVNESSIDNPVLMSRTIGDVTGVSP